MRNRCLEWAMMTVVMVIAIFPRLSVAMPEFARRYNVSCTACHSAFPRLNQFGHAFIAANYKMPNWRESNTISLGDDMLALPKTPPLALRMQTFAQLREGSQIDRTSGVAANKSEFDFQAPYLIKLLSSAPLSENLTYYFYGIFAEKGDNGTAIIEDAWIRHANLFGSGIGLQVGQFQVSDLMFPREVRLTFQDFYAYRAAGVTYERGVILDRELAGIDVAVGAVNGNGINDNFSINSPGFQRPDRLFDNDNKKSIFARLGYSLGFTDIGIFGLMGEQRSAAGVLGDSSGTRATKKVAQGLDLSGTLSSNIHWFGQVVWNQWEGLLDTHPDRDSDWFGGFLGIDYVHNERWVYSLLWNYVDGSTFHGTGTIYEGLKMNALTIGTSYYFMRNVKGVIEATADLMETDQSGPPHVGHQSQEHSLIVGFDVAL